MSAFPFPAGKRMVNKSPLKVRLNFTDQKVVDNPIGKISGKDFSNFGVGINKADGTLGLVGIVVELFLQIKQVGFKI